MSSFTHEIVSPVSADQLYKASMADWHNLGPKIAPEVIVSASNTGEFKVGSVREMHFTSALPFSYVKERLDYVDNEKFEVKGTLVEGGILGKKLESCSSHYKFEPSSDGGCVVKVVVSYKALPGISEADEMAKTKETITAQIKETITAQIKGAENLLPMLNYVCFLV